MLNVCSTARRRSHQVLFDLAISAIHLCYGVFEASMLAKGEVGENRYWSKSRVSEYTEVQRRTAGQQL